MKWPRVRRRPGSRAGAPKPLSARDLLWRFTAAGVLVLGALAGLLALLARQTGTEQAMERASEATFLIAEAVVEPRLTPEVVAGDPEALREFSPQLQAVVPEGSLVRVKVWDPDGQVVYSDEPRLVGARFTLDDEELRRSAGARTPEVTDLSAPENRYETGDELLEVYLPTRHPRAAVAVRGVLPRQRRRGRPPVAVAALRAHRPGRAGRAARAAAGGVVDGPAVAASAGAARAPAPPRHRRLPAERRRIAGDLHDGPVQDLAGVALSLAAALRRPPGQPIDETIVVAGGGRCGAASRAAHAAHRHPPTRPRRGRLGLGRRRPPRGRGAVPGLATELDIDLPGDVPSEAAGLLYRGTQEALRNVTAHAGATLVAVRARGATASARWSRSTTTAGASARGPRRPGRAGPPRPAGAAGPLRRGGGRALGALRRGPGDPGGDAGAPPVTRPPGDPGAGGRRPRGRAARPRAAARHGGRRGAGGDGRATASRRWPSRPGTTPTWCSWTSPCPTWTAWRPPAGSWPPTPPPRWSSSPRSATRPASWRRSTPAPGLPAQARRARELLAGVRDRHGRGSPLDPTAARVLLRARRAGAQPNGPDRS